MEQENSKTEVVMEKSSSFAFKGILEVFYKPTEFFNELKNEPKILVPYVFFTLVVFTSLFLLQDLIVQMQVSSPQFVEQMEKSGQAVTPELISIMKISTLVLGTISFSLYPLIVAAFALFFGNFIFAGKSNFKSLLSVSLYGGILFMLGGLAVVPMMLAKGSMMVSFSLAVLVTNLGIESIPYVALSKISIFHIWEIMVVGIGFSTLYNFPRNKGYLLAVLSVGLLSIFHIGLTAVGAMFN